MQQISLEALLPVNFDPTTCKLHCAVFNGDEHPIDVLANDPVGWQGWNSWRAGKDDFNRKFIFSLAQDRRDATLWLFGGIWEVLERRPQPHARSYVVAHRDDLMDCVPVRGVGPCDSRWPVGQVRGAAGKASSVGSLVSSATDAAAM